MKTYILVLLFFAAMASCSEPAGITARPDPTAATSGTIGSSKATDGIIPFQPSPVRDSTRQR
jgi:hypothetical protein